MKLQLHFDERIMKQYYDRGSLILFGIYWVHNNIAYPSADWTDFGAVILGWWLQAALQMMQGSRQEEFFFMDGPFALFGQCKNDQLVFSARRSSEQWTTTLEEFASEIVSGAEAVVAELARLEIGKSDQNSLSAGVRALRTFLH